MTAVDDRTEDHVRAVLRAVAAATTIPERPALDVTTPVRLVGDLDGPRRARRRLPPPPARRVVIGVAVAAAVLALAGMAALMSDDGPDTRTGSEGTTPTTTEPGGYRGPVYGLDPADLPAGFVAMESTVGDLNAAAAAPLDADVYELDGGGVAAVVTGPTDVLAEGLADDFGAADDGDRADEGTPLGNGTTADVLGTDNADSFELAVRGDGRWLGAIQANGATLAEVLPLAEHIADAPGDRPGRLVESTTTHEFALDPDRVGARITYVDPDSASGSVTTGEVTVKTESGIGIDPLVPHLADQQVDVAGHTAYLSSIDGEEIWVTWEPEPGVVVTLNGWAWGQEGLDAAAVLDLAGKVHPVVTAVVPRAEEAEEAEPGE